MTHTDPDCDILEHYSLGHLAEVQHLLCERYRKYIYHYCYKALSDTMLADDICQEILWIACRNLGTFERRSALRTWIVAITRRRVLDAAKSRRRRQTREAAFVEYSGEHDPRASLVESLDEHRLREVLIYGVRRLPDYPRSVLLLRYQQGFTYEEMAEIFGEKAGTLQAVAQRALRSLRELASQRGVMPETRTITSASRSARRRLQSSRAFPR